MTPWEELLFRMDWDLIKAKKWGKLIEGIEWDLERGIFNPLAFIIDVIFFVIMISIVSILALLIFR